RGTLSIFTRSARLSTAPSFSGLPFSGQQSRHGASGASVGSIVGATEVVCGAAEAPGVAAGELQAASRTRMAMRANECPCGAPFLILLDCSGRCVPLLDARPSSLTWHRA